MNPARRRFSKLQTALFRGAIATTASISLLAPGLSQSVSAELQDSPKAVLDEAWQIVNREYVDGSFNKTNWQATRQELLSKNYTSREAAYEALRKALEKLDDPYTRFMDPDFSYGVTLAKTGGRLVLRLSEAEILPFDFQRLSATIGRYVGEVVKLADDLRDEATERNRRLQERTYELTDDPKSSLVPPKALDPVPFLNLAPLRNGADTLARSTRAWEKAVEARADKPLTTAEAEALNILLFRAERALTRAAGLPRRPWFQHQIYAPGFYTGYGVKTLAPVREALEQRSWKEAEEQAVVLGEVLAGYAREVDKATAVLAGK